MNKVTFRIIIDLLIFISLVNAWWFFIIPLGLIGLWFFPYFFEIILAGIAYDGLYGLVPGMGTRAFIATIIAVVTMIVFAVLKRMLRK
jgi:hypothetical protein